MPQPFQPVACPNCHTPHSSPADDALLARDSWVCVRCGQHWNAERLTAVARYADRTLVLHSGRAGWAAPDKRVGERVE